MNRLKKNNGLSMVEVLILVGLISVISAGVITVAQQFIRMQSQNNQKMMAVELRDELKKTISDQAAWNKTISDLSLNPDGSVHFDCIRNSTDCSSVASAVPIYDFIPKTATDTVYKNTYNPIANPNQGFSTDGTVCNTFAPSTVVATTNCAFRFTFKWAPDCTGFALGTCIDPRVIVSISFSHNPVPGIIIIPSGTTDPNSISKVFMRGLEFDNLTLQSICYAYGPGSSYNPLTGRCVQAVVSQPVAVPLPVPVYVPVPAPVPFPVPPACTSSTCSDLRVKKEIRSFDLGLSEVLRLRPVTFKYNGLAGSQNDNQNYTGVIAQELEKVAPVLVQEKDSYLSPDDSSLTPVKTVHYEGISMMLVNAVQELNRRVDHLEKENRKLRKSRARENSP